MCKWPSELMRYGRVLLLTSTQEKEYDSGMEILPGNFLFHLKSLCAKGKFYEVDLEGHACDKLKNHRANP